MKPFGIISIKTQKGKSLYRAYQSQKKYVIAPDACQKIKVMMHEVVTSGTGKRANISQIECYGKTGTSNDSRDASFVGFSVPLVTGIWAGNDDNTPMNPKITGGTLPAMAWKEFMLMAFGLKQPAQKVEIEKKPVVEIGANNDVNKNKSKDDSKNNAKDQVKNENKKKKPRKRISDLLNKAIRSQ
jgi:membrane peptidoglycan carboxypeptidase